MPTEYNKGRAEELLHQLDGEKTINEWIAIIIKVLGFLLNRYRLGD